MKNISPKEELKNTLYSLFEKDYKFDVYNTREVDTVFIFYHLNSVYNSFCYCDYDGNTTINLGYAKPTKWAIKKAEKCARAYIMLVKQGKQKTADEILLFFKERLHNVFKQKYSIATDTAFYNL